MSDPQPFTCVFLVRSLDVGGAERQLVELARVLHVGGVRVSVVTFYPGGAFSAALERAGVKVLSMNKKGRWEVVRFLRRLVKTIRGERPDVLYSFMPGANILAVAVRYLAPLPLVVWGVRASSLDFSKYGWLVRVESMLCAWAAHLADIIVCNSSAGLEHHAALGYPVRKMHVIRNGIDCNAFKFDTGARARLRAEWQVAEDEVLVGLVARVDPMKGHADFLEAAAILCREVPFLRFVCVGSGPAELSQTLRSLASELGLADRVIWTGQRTDVSTIYSALDVVTSASRFGEGFSNSIAEAMACERVCVVTAVGDSASVVGTLGRVVQARDPAALASGIKDLACLPARERAELGRAARLRVQSAFSVGQMVDQTASLIGIPLPQSSEVFSPLALK